jgi:hypothetical protein
LRRIGGQWSKFVRNNTGQKTTLRVWRKVIETESAKQNSFNAQQTLSSALLHQHKTGQDYYVTHHPHEKSKQVLSVWETLMACENRFLVGLIVS